MSESQNSLHLVSHVWYLKHSLSLLLVLWFGLPHPCTTTRTFTLTGNTGGNHNNNKTLWLRVSHRVFECCQMGLLQGSPPSVACLKWVSLWRVARRAWCMHHHLNSPVFPGACRTAAALREDRTLLSHEVCLRTREEIIHFKDVSYLSCVCVFVCWASSCRLCRRCCPSSCCAPAAHRCRAENLRHSGNSPSMSWDPVCLCLDGTVLKWTCVQTCIGLYVCAGIPSPTFATWSFDDDDKMK